MSTEMVCPTCEKVLIPFRWGEKHYIKAGTDNTIVCQEGMGMEPKANVTKPRRKRYNR